MAAAAILDWRELLPAPEWAVFRPVLAEAVQRQMRFQIGGGIASALYGGRMRLTKDLDLFVLPAHRLAFIELLDKHSFGDYFERVPYERHWLYRGTRNGALLDVIWQMPNHLAEVDELWLSRGTPIILDGMLLQAIPLEEMIWAKLFVMQRDRCDWPDLLNALNLQIEHVQWEHLLRRLGPHVPLLHGLMEIFVWICPRAVDLVPQRVWRQLGRRTRADGQQDVQRQRVDLLDRRDWFGPMQRGCVAPPEGQP